MKQNYAIPRGSLEGIEEFLRVAGRRSFRQAADDLGVTPSAVSQAVRTLEGRLGVALFTRTTRSVGLTEAGERFVELAGPAFDDMIAASDAARGLAERPSGLLRIAVPRAIVPLILEPILASFSEAYPEVTVEIAASEELVDLAKEGFDAGIRMAPFIADDMIAVRLAPPFRLVFVASPSYFAKHGRPSVPDDLRHQACIRIRRSSGAIGTWRMMDEGRSIEVAVTGPLIANDFPTILGASISGVGLAQVPEPVAAAHLAQGTLEEVMCDRAPTIPGVFLFHSGRRQVLPKLRAFIEHARLGAQSTGNLGA